MTPKRPRELSAQEIEVWESVARQVKPLRKRKAAKPEPAPPIAAPGGKAAKSAKAETAAPPQTVPPKKIPPPLAPLARRERSQLSRGRTEIDARIDLHGMTQARAHRALLTFLQNAAAEGAGFVLVITGKGRGAAHASERGVLRRQVPLWLQQAEFRALVVGYDEAGIGHGGEGALYVRLRRGRVR